MKKFLLTVFALSANLLAESYKVDTIKTPLEIAPEIGGLAFNPSGELVVVTRRSGIQIAKTAKDPNGFQWRSFSDDSLHNPCGVQVISDSEMFISQMAELTKVSDTDKDGIADSYELISNEFGLSGNYHETNYILPDKKGGWYIAVGTASHNGPTFYHTQGEYKHNGRRGRNFAAVKWKGWVMHIDAKGKITPFAKGFRMHNGMGMSPDGKIFAGDNQGDWRGTSPIYHVQKDKFYGHPSALVWDEKFVKEVSDNPLFYYINNMKQYEKDRTPAAIELPQGMICNSPGEIIFDTKGNFGPFKGQAFVGDIAGPRIVRLMFEEVDGVMQGACIKFVEKKVRTGNNRLVFSPKGDELYVGQTVRGWGKPSEGIQRISFNGEMPDSIQKVELTQEGFHITFTKEKSPQDLANIANYAVQSYHYPSTHKYGSKPMDRKNIQITKVDVGSDKKSVLIHVNSLQTKRLYQIDVKNTLASCLDQARAIYKINRLQPGTVVKEVKIEKAEPATVKLSKGKDKVTVTVDGKLFTEFIQGPNKPCLYPVNGPNQENLTRHYPFKKGVKNEKPDHPWHTGIYFTFGKINDIDFWNTRTGKDKYIKNVDLQTDGSKILAHNQWIHNDKKVLSDITEITFSADSKKRFIDYKVTLNADTKDLVFGDTKEGMMAIRMDPSFKVSGQGATVLNSSGTSGKGVWGKEAKWVSYNNIQGSVISIMDHPKNLRHPSRWHARDYGLCATNPFGQNSYTKKKLAKDPFTLKKGQQITFQYRFAFHKETNDKDSINKLYNSWTQK
ncbi:probable large, multifunctional secreted protein [Lentisphaera araneosa HTCC2155]|uniref:Probable large, multifunctional secreted protein n=1 Tax=Lentisphaera araneosa HTCC2155 TaxID=313628 RepID=A6DIY7_9BACT|nr:DUF6807 family protein [Lentisphaera araneosa]EDM28423.1 probable large, multifunctional secreted protein [Lentisphaera araneosa HTCC2155]